MGQASTVRPTEEVANFFAQGPTVEEIATFRLSDTSRERLRGVLYTNSAGTLTASESEELDEMATLSRIIMLIRSRIAKPGAGPE
ncbi:MAG TPA: hypothetical protein VJN88_07505 [Ktedonobacterales bacterium]|nr:hypothetical protein [Ktedonobacterales bacterium]